MEQEYKKVRRLRKSPQRNFKKGDLALIGHWDEDYPGRIGSVFEVRTDNEQNIVDLALPRVGLIRRYAADIIMLEDYLPSDALESAAEAFYPYYFGEGDWLNASDYEQKEVARRVLPILHAAMPYLLENITNYAARLMDSPDKVLAEDVGKELMEIVQRTKTQEGVSEVAEAALRPSSQGNPPIPQNLTLGG